MWLPRDERRMLVHYYKGLSSVDSRMPFFLKDLEKSLGEPNARGRAKIASKTLQQRNLIAFLDDRGDALRVQLSLEGYDLGRKYASWFDWSGLWFAEYKNHWIWIIISFLGGVIGALLINWLST